MRLTADEWASHKLMDIPIAWMIPLVDETRQGDKVLEWGVGTGDHGILLKKLGRRNFGADFSRDLIERLAETRYGLYEDLRVADFTEQWPYADNSMDVVFSSGLVEHFTEGELVPIFAEHMRVASKRIVFLAPNAKCKEYMEWKAEHEKNGTWEYGIEIPRESYAQFFPDKTVREWSVGDNFGATDERYLLVTVVDL